MITVDSSTWIAFLQGNPALDTLQLRSALQAEQVKMVPIVLTELLSSIGRTGAIRDLLIGIPMLDVLPGFWLRAGELRGQTLDRGRKAAFADVLIAQSCLDYDLPLLTRDADFRVFAGFGLRLLLPTATD